MYSSKDYFSDTFSPNYKLTQRSLCDSYLFQKHVFCPKSETDTFKFVANEKNAILALSGVLGDFHHRSAPFSDMVTPDANHELKACRVPALTNLSKIPDISPRNSILTRSVKYDDLHLLPPQDAMEKIITCFNEKIEEIEEQKEFGIVLHNFYYADAVVVHCCDRLGQVNLNSLSAQWCPRQRTEDNKACHTLNIYQDGNKVMNYLTNGSKLGVYKPIPTDYTVFKLGVVGTVKVEDAPNASEILDQLSKDSVI